MPEPLSISAYKNVSELGLSQLALVTNGRGRTEIGAASAKVGFLQRLFNTSASKAVNIAITSDFKASLTRAYNAKVADEAFAAVIGKDGLKGAKLSSTLVRKTLTAAQEIYKKNLDCPVSSTNMLTMHLEGKDEDFNLSTLFSVDKDVMFDAKKTLTKLHDLLMDMPTDKLAFNDFKEKILEVKEHAEFLMTDGDKLLKIKRRSDVNVDKVFAALSNAVSMVDGKLTEAKEVCDSNPITYKSLTDFADKFIVAAKNVLSSLPNSGSAYGLTGETQMQLRHTFNKLLEGNSLSGAIPKIPNGATDNDICLDPKAFIGKDFAQKVAKHCADLVVKDLKDHVTTGNVAFETVAFTKDLGKAIEKEMGNILNNGSWDQINKDVTFSLDGVAMKGKSVITPASRMGGPMQEIYNDGGPKGYNCASFGEKKHAVNMAHSEFRVEINGQQQTVFSGIRHGVHAAVDVEDKVEFEKANVSRAKETLIAAFMSNQALLDKALEKPSEPFTFVFNSVSLLTPDIVRGTFFNKHENEKMMLKAQTEAYQSLNGQEIEVQVKDKNDNPVTVKIKRAITTFNYGVNWGGVGGLSSLFGGWGESKDMNAKGLVSLNAFANKTLSELETKISQNVGSPETQSLQNKAKAIRTLLRQINNIDQQKTYSSDGHEAYKMASRIAVLTNLLGGVPAWNCKSGKDRTGMMDVECKFLATLVALGEEIPQPGAQLNAEQKLLYRNLLLQSGNHEMQKYNTGVAGYKLEGVESITERIGDIASQKVFLGASKIVNS